MPFQIGCIPWNKGLKTGPHSEESNRRRSRTLRGNIPWNKGGRLSIEDKQKKSKAHLGLPSGMLGKHHTEESKQLISNTTRGERNPMFGKHHTEESKQLMSSLACRRWQNAEFAQMMYKAWDRKPTKPEVFIGRILYAIYSGSFEYTGNGIFWVGGKNPDFVDEKNKKIIEVNGVYWHTKVLGISRDQAEKERKEHFAKYGYQTLIIWDDELNDLDAVVQKVDEFLG